MEDKGKTADLLTLFSKQAQKSELQSQSNGSKTSPLVDLDDLVSDPISEDDDVALHKTAASSIVEPECKEEIQRELAQCRIRFGYERAISQAPEAVDSGPRQRRFPTMVGTIRPGPSR